MFLCSHVKDSEVECSVFAVGLDIFNEPCVSGSHLPQVSSAEAFGRI